MDPVCRRGVRSRKAPRDGDVFEIDYGPRGVVHGRVIDTAASGQLNGPAEFNLVYIFDGLKPHGIVVDDLDLRVGNLLTSPVLTNRLGWSRGYFTNVGRRKFGPGEKLEAHRFYSPRKGIPDRLFDEHGNEVFDTGGLPRDLTGIYGVGSYSSIDARICQKLDLSPEEN